MTDLPPDAERALEAHDAFEPTEEGYDLATTVFDVDVTATAGDGARDARFRVVVTLPTLDAAVADDAVAPVVEEGWFETLTRRLRDTFAVAHTSTYEDPVAEREADAVRVVLEYVAWDAGEGVEDAKTLVEYVEGTYAQGLIPGYEYRGEAATLLENAQSRGQGAADGGDTGTPL